LGRYGVTGLGLEEGASDWYLVTAAAVVIVDRSMHSIIEREEPFHSPISPITPSIQVVERSQIT
jgi:hypothetical protein